MREYFAKSGSPFHVYSRGTEKRRIFTQYAEYCRFVFLMWVCQIGKPAVNSSRQDVTAAAEAILRGEKPREHLYTEEFQPLVSLINWNLMPNHYHFMLIARVEGGISKYMQKLGNAFTKYFNTRHQRNGRLFQGSYQSVAVDDPRYLAVLLRYINFNHAELVEPKWKEHIIKNRRNMKKFVDAYQWSAHMDFAGRRKSLLVDREAASDLFEEKFDSTGLVGYEKFMGEWLNDDFEEIKRYTLED